MLNRIRLGEPYIVYRISLEEDFKGCEHGPLTKPRAACFAPVVFQQGLGASGVHHCKNLMYYSVLFFKYIYSYLFRCLFEKQNDFSSLVLKQFSKLNEVVLRSRKNLPINSQRTHLSPPQALLFFKNHHNSRFIPTIMPRSHLSM